jgi:hypothetical protein
MRRIPLVPLREDEVDLVLLLYRVEQAEREIDFLKRQPQQQLERKEAQAVINGTTVQFLMFASVILVELLNLFNVHL